MPETPSVDTLIGDLLDAGASEEEIGAAVQQFKASQKPPTLLDKASDYVGKELSGAWQGVKSLADPKALLDVPMAIADVTGPGLPGRNERIMARGKGLIGLGADALNVTRPEKQGEALAKIFVPALAGKAASIAVPRIPEGIAATGRGLEAAGGAAKPFSAMGALEEIARTGSVTKGAAAAALPWVAQGAGKLLQKGGEMLGATPKEAPVMPPPVGVEVPASVAEMTARAARIKTAPPARLGVDEVPAAGGDASEALAAMKQKPTDLKSFLTGQRPPMPDRPASPLAAQMAQQEIPSASSLLDTLKAPAEATGGGADLSSPLAQQLLQSLAERAPSSSKTGSAIPGLTEADIAVIEKAMRDARATRHAQHYEDAVSEAAAKRSVARGRPNASK